MNPQGVGLSSTCSIFPSLDANRFHFDYFILPKKTSGLNYLHNSQPYNNIYSKKHLNCRDSIGIWNACKPSIDSALRGKSEASHGGNIPTSTTAHRDNPMQCTMHLSLP